MAKRTLTEYQKFREKQNKSANNILKLLLLIGIVLFYGFYKWTFE